MKQKFRNGRRVDPADAKEKEKENSQPNLVDGVSEPPAKKQRKSTAKSRIASEGMCYVMSHVIKAQYMYSFLIASFPGCHPQLFTPLMHNPVL